MKEYKTLKVEKKDKICVLTMNRPDKLNALSFELINELHHFFTAIADDSETGVIILRGEGRAFCVGADLAEATTSSSDKNSVEQMGPVQQHYEKVMKVLGKIILLMRECPQPIIGAVHSYAIGGGFNIALACDVRIAAESLQMGTGAVRIGLSGAEMGNSYFLPKIIGFSRAAEYLYTGRIIDAATACRIGLVSRLVPVDKLENEAFTLAQEMLQGSPFELRMMKETHNLNANAPDLKCGLELEKRQQSLMASYKNRQI